MAHEWGMVHSKSQRELLANSIPINLPRSTADDRDTGTHTPSSLFARCDVYLKGHTSLNIHAVFSFATVFYRRSIPLEMVF